MTPSLAQIHALAETQKARREEAQARIREAQRSRDEAEAEVRRAMLVEYHLHRAGALSRDDTKLDRFEEAYLRWHVGRTQAALTLDPLMFDTEKVYRLVRFLASKGQLPADGFDAQALRLEFPNWIDDLALVPTDGSIRSALKALALRRTGLHEGDERSGVFVYDPQNDAMPRFRRKADAND